MRLAVITSHMESRPQELLEMLIDDPSYMVKEEVALNPLTPPAALTAMEHDEDEGIRLSLLKNPSSPPGQDERMAQEDPSPEVRKTAAMAMAQKQRQA